LFCFFFHRYGHQRDLHSFPTRRSSDLNLEALETLVRVSGMAVELLSVARPTPKRVSEPAPAATPEAQPSYLPTSEYAQPTTTQEDRKSTRLNSSHVAISYAVFCLKKKR